MSWNHRIEEAEMVRYSRWWPRVLLGLAVLILVAGAVASLIIWRTRSSSTLEVLDTGALRDTVEGVVENTSSIAEGWKGQDLSSDLDGLVVAQQQSLALLAGEIVRTRDLIAEVEGRGQSEEAGSLKSSERALASLSESQSQLEEALREAGRLLASLDPLAAADALYGEGRTMLLVAVESHNQAVAAEPTSFAAAIQDASSAAAALQESLATLEAIKLDGLDLGAAASTISGLENTAQRFVEACRKGETDDVEGHNSLMTEAQAGLSASPASILSSIDLSTWLIPRIESHMQPVFEGLEEARGMLNG